VLFYYLGLLFYLGIFILGWVFRGRLFGSSPAVDLYFLSIAAGGLVFITVQPLIEGLRNREQRLAWRRRLEEVEGIPRPSGWWVSLGRINQRINSSLLSGFQRGIGRIILGLWKDAGFGSQPGTLLAVLFLIIIAGGLGGYFLTGSPLLSGFVTVMLLIGFFALIYSRARTQRQLFQDQFPGVLDRLADSLKAGFSLPQAIEFVVPNLSQPSSSEMAQITAQIKMGFSVDQALLELHQRHPNEDVRLLVEGLTLQRQVGGNMAEMMREMAGMVRMRVELGNEVRTMTAQGRLSAVVIALLVPVSLGLLSMFPGYTDVLFNTTVGNLVLIAAGVLELIGTVIVLRLIRIEV